MYGIFTYIYHKNQPNVGKYTIHGSYGSCLIGICKGPRGGDSPILFGEPQSSQGRNPENFAGVTPSPWTQSGFLLPIARGIFVDIKSLRRWATQLCYKWSPMGPLYMAL